MVKYKRGQGQSFARRGGVKSKKNIRNPSPQIKGANEIRKSNQIKDKISNSDEIYNYKFL